MFKMSENRQHTRLLVIGLAQIRGEPSEPPLNVQILDISYTGMRIHVKEPIAGQVEVFLCELHYSQGNTDRAIAEWIKAEVSWIKKKGDWYFVGLKFDGLNPQDHGATLAFLDQYVKIE